MEKRARKFGVNRRALLVTAGIVWIVAGANILRIGVVTWASQSHYGLFRAGEAIVVFLLFFNLVFKRLFYKHTQRIERKGDRNCPFSFFDAKGWIVMCFMILFGILARTCRWLPETFIAVFYTGLSAALIVTGVLFLRYRYRKKDRLSILSGVEPGDVLWHYHIPGGRAFPHAGPPQYGRGTHFTPVSCAGCRRAPRGTLRC